MKRKHIAGFYLLNLLQILQNTDDILINLIKEETLLFNDKINRLAENVLPLYYRTIYHKETCYKNMDKLIDSIIETYNQVNTNSIDIDTFIENISKEIIPAAQHIATSNSQSAKSRAGASLENHLATLMDKCGFSFEPQQKIENGETIADFFLPNVQSAHTNPSLVINIECQTTLKDRHRLTTGKLTGEPVIRYLATGTGCGLFTKNDIKDFTLEKRC